MKTILIILILLTPFIVFADCSSTVYDYDSGKYLDNTDAKKKCGEAVKEAVKKAVEEAVKAAVYAACDAGYITCITPCILERADKCYRNCQTVKDSCENY